MQDSLNVNELVLWGQRRYERFRVRPKDDQGEPQRYCIWECSFNRKSFCNKSRTDMAAVWKHGSCRSCYRVLENPAKTSLICRRDPSCINKTLRLFEQRSGHGQLRTSAFLSPLTPIMSLSYTQLLHLGQVLFILVFFIFASKLVIIITQFLK